MRSIGVFFNDPGFDEYPFTEEDYRSSYQELGLTLRAKNAEMVVVRGKDTYRGGNRFQGGWRFTGEGYERVEGEIDVDVIYNKGSELVTDASANVVNHPGLDAICRDKMRSYETFPEHFPKTILVKDLEEGRLALQQMRTDHVVLKPADGWGGKKVWIGPKADAAEYFEPYPVMLQELIDTSGGIPGSAPGTHDFRLVMANDRVLLTYVRMPADGSLFPMSRRAVPCCMCPPRHGRWERCAWPKRSIAVSVTSGTVSTASIAARIVTVAGRSSS
jgi:hypothetical protein